VQQGKWRSAHELLDDHHAERFRVEDGDLVFLISTPLDEISAPRDEPSMKASAVRMRRLRERRRRQRADR
jgi:hypothetical protein